MLSAQRAVLPSPQVSTRDSSFSYPEPSASLAPPALELTAVAQSESEGDLGLEGMADNDDNDDNDDTADTETPNEDSADIVDKHKRGRLQISDEVMGTEETRASPIDLPSSSSSDDLDDSDDNDDNDDNNDSNDNNTEDVVLKRRPPAQPVQRPERRRIVPEADTPSPSRATTAAKRRTPTAATIKPAASSKPAKVFYEWWLRLTSSGVLVCGFEDKTASDTVWRSSRIAKRLAARLLETQSGTRYRLDDELNVRAVVCHALSCLVMPCHS